MAEDRTTEVAWLLAGLYLGGYFDHFKEELSKHIGGVAPMYVASVVVEVTESIRSSLTEPQFRQFQDRMCAWAKEEAEAHKARLAKQRCPQEPPTKASRDLFRSKPLGRCILSLGHEKGENATPHRWEGE